MKNLFYTLPILVFFTTFACKKSRKVQEDPLPPAQPSATKGIKIDTIASELQIPWGLSFLPNGDLMFCERYGKIRLVKQGEKSATTIMARSVWASGEGGLLGLAVDPDFISNHFIYIYESMDSNQVIRLKFENGILKDDKRILRGIPMAVNHDGGALKFGPDGYLYVGTGDATKSELAQDKNSLGGKILRIDREGNAAPGNPFNNKVWSYGHRNVQGFSWTKKGNMLATEHGPSTEFGWCCHDEINLIVPGNNYGWPLALGGTETGTLSPPLVHSGNDTWAPSGCTALGAGSVWPNCLLVACLRGEKLIRFYLNASENGIQSQSDTLFNAFDRLRCVAEGPDGAIYFGSSNLGVINPPKVGDDKLYRISIR